jgi:hypothetical protein
MNNWRKEFGIGLWRRWPHNSSAIRRIYITTISRRTRLRISTVSTLSSCGCFGTSLYSSRCQKRVSNGREGTKRMPNTRPTTIRWDQVATLLPFLNGKSRARANWQGLVPESLDWPESAKHWFFCSRRPPRPRDQKGRVWGTHPSCSRKISSSPLCRSKWRVVAEQR